VIVSYEERAAGNSIKAQPDAAGQVAKLKRRARFEKYQFGLTLAALIASFLLLFFWDQFVVSLQAGQQGVYWSRFFGTSNVLLGDGAHFKLPWDEITVYEIRLATVSRKTLLLTQDGLEIDVEWAAQYHPMSAALPTLHRLVGPRYEEKIIIPDSVSSLRQILGNYTAEQIYSTDEKEIVDKLQTRVRQLVANYGLDLEKMQILRLDMPKEVADGIVRKILDKQNLLSYDFRLKAEQEEKERKTIEAEGIQSFESISKVSILKWRAIKATEALAKSPNSKIIIMGTGANGLPVLLNADK
jgi:regulator of protease activity HflC (stomatin/prohibitin superfamily)